MRRMWFYSAALAAALALPPGCNPGGGTPDAVGRLFTRDGLDTVKLAIELYRRETGRYPESLDQLVAQKRIKGTSVVKDAWRNTYRYSVTSEGYTLFSAGPDGVPHTADDVHPGW